MEKTIYLQDNPKTGACSLTEHFIKEWVKNDKLHPKAKATKYVFDVNADKDVLDVLDDEGEVVFSLEGNDALRLDELQEFLIKN